ncbi:MAG: NAD(P)/FAD-dependent oxidoreductase [Cyanobacteria bacterium J06626_14]
MKVIVIGGGAAGFFGAIACAEAWPNARITILEAGAQPLSKVRISGGGRCNVTHACFEPSQLIQHYPRGSKALRGAFSRFQPKDTVDWFAQRQVQLKTEDDGRMFPITDDSETIIDALMTEAESLGVRIKTKAVVTHVAVSPAIADQHDATCAATPDSTSPRAASNSRFTVELRGGHTLTGDRLLLATGSNPKGYAIAHQLGHEIQSPVPSLFTFQIPDSHLHSLAGIAVERVHAQLHCAGYPTIKQEGAVLITHWGLSGPAILKLSAWGARQLHDCHYHATLRVSWLPQHSIDDIRDSLLMFKQEHMKRAIATVNPFMFPRRLWEYLIHSSAINDQTQGGDRWANLSKKDVNRLAKTLTQHEFEIHGKGTFKDEFVTCGGISLKSVNFKTMESRLCSGLYFAGEVLDIDGVTGGFNFQSAWTTGWIAGHAMGKPAAV